MNIPLCIPNTGEEEVQAIREVLKSGWLAHGPKTKQFEKEFAGYVGTKKAVSLNSCTSALQLAMMAHKIKGEVILPSFTFAASANSVINAGAKPVFADIEYDACNIDAGKIKVTEKTEAIMPVHFAGQSCRMDEIMEIAEKHNLVVIEDSAECVGGKFRGKNTGSFGTGCFSFYPTKNMTTGEGGMVTSDDEKIADAIRALSAHGISGSAFQREKQKRPWIRAAEMAGFNFRLCDVLSAIGLVQLKKLDYMNDKRRKNSAYLNKALGEFEQIETPVEEKDCKHVYQTYTIKLKGNRTAFIAKLREQGVGANVHFDPPVHLQPYYKGYCKKGSLPITEDVSERIVTLPMYPQLSKEEMDYMVQVIDKSLKGI